MAVASHVNDVHILNLMFLTAVQKAINDDAARACALYGLTAEDAARIKVLSMEALHTLAGSLNECVATLRLSGAALIALSTAPAPLQTVMGALIDLPTSSMRVAA